MNPIPLGSIITDPHAGRDAVHIAIIPMIATRTLQPGERLRNGVVDPFLTAPIAPGERYYLCLFPHSVTSLRHVWQNPAFADEDEPAPDCRRSEATVWGEALR